MDQPQQDLLQGRDVELGVFSKAQRTRRTWPLSLWVDGVELSGEIFKKGPPAAFQGLRAQISERGEVCMGRILPVLKGDSDV